LLKVSFCGYEFGEEAFFGLELTGVNAAAAGFDADGVLEVEHLVVEEVLDGAAGRAGAVEDAGHDDGVVSSVVVAEHAASVVSGPRECGAAEEAVEEAGVERFEDLVEIVVVAGRCGETLAAAGLTNVLGLFGDGLGGDVAAVAVGVEARDGFSVELGEEDVGDRVMDVVGCGFEDVGEANVEAAFAEPDGGVERGEAAEANVERGDWGAGTEFAVLVLEDRDEGCGGGDLFCAGLFGLRGMERCCGYLVEESGGRWCWRRRKELQELAQR
jgi:hypothetical protein